MKPLLKVISGPCGTVEKFQLFADRAFVAGRAGVGSAVFAADGLMSTRHFSLTMTPQGFFLTDLGSSNGTYVNGERVVHYEIKSGDQILAGSTVFQFEIEIETVSPSTSSQSPQQSILNESPQPCLTIASNNGQERVLCAGQRITIGRADLSEWVFPSDPRMSSEHMAIRSIDRDWEVVDLTSSNGTYVNETRITQCRLRSGDSIVAGGTAFSIAIVAATKLTDDVRLPGNTPIPSSASIAVFSDPIWKQPTRVADSLPAESIPLKETQVDIDPVPIFRVTIDCLTQPSLSADFQQGQQLIIGRSIYADVSVPNDVKMSSEHVRLRILSNQVLLEDLMSTNGTEVNGIRINEVALNHGDQLSIGSQSFCIRIGGREAPLVPVAMVRAPILEPLISSETRSNRDTVSSIVTQQSRLPMLVGSDAPMLESTIPFESFPCGSGLVFFSGCVPTFDPIDIARRLTLATPGWLLKQDEGGSATVSPQQISIERISPMDPSWMIPWSQTWGQHRSLVIYSRSDESKVKSTFQSLFESLNATSQKFPSHSNLFDFLANRLSDTVNRVFAPLDAILIELYGGKQWAYLAPRDLESVLPQLQFRKKHRW